jgi:transcriptional regulator with XRE-family HTH domain
MGRADTVRAEMARYQVTVRELAKRVGVGEQSLSLKLRGKSPIWIDEAMVIHEYLKGKGSGLSLQEMFQ